MTLNRDELITRLQKETVNIEFTKADGTNRVMNATLKESIVPETTGPSRAKDTNVIVFDTDIKQWRTVVVDRITKIST